MASEQVNCAVPLHWVDEIVTASWLAQYYGVTRQTIYNQMKRGMPSIKVGRSRRFRLAEVDAWIEAQQTEVGGAAAEQAAEDAADATDLDRMRSQRDEARGELQRLTASAADLASEWESRRDQHRRSPGGLLDRADAYDLCAEELRVLLAGDPR